MQIKESEESKVGGRERRKNVLKTDERKTTTQIYPELRDGVRKDKEMGPNPHKQLPAIPGITEKKPTV